MNLILAAAVELERFLRRRKWPFCMIGGLAAIRWGTPRTTNDVDVSLFTGLGDEGAFVEDLIEQFAPRVEDVKRFAMETRVVLLSATNGTPLDISLAGFPFEERMIERSSRHKFMKGATLTTTSREDTIVLKSFAGRRQDWADVEGIVIRQAGQIDWLAVEQRLRELREIGELQSPLETLAEIRVRCET